MPDINKYQPPSGPPPAYPQQAHYDAAAFDSRGPGFPSPQNQLAPYQQPKPNDTYNGPEGPFGPQGQYGYPPQPYNQGWGGGPPPGGYYGGPAPGGYYSGPPPGGMYYQQQPPTGYYQGQRGTYGSGAEGICAGLLGALACCCCLEMLF